VVAALFIAVFLFRNPKCHNVSFKSHNNLRKSHNHLRKSYNQRPKSNNPNDHEQKVKIITFKRKC